VIHRAKAFDIESGLAVPWFETGFGRRLLKTVPRADVLANVAAIDPSLQVGCDLIRQRLITELDRSVRNAAPCVDNIRLDDGLRRACIDTSGACAAMVFTVRQVVIELDIEDECADKNRPVRPRLCP
jgi:hypothetical protein